jgi:hypothetical protein
VYPEAVAGKTAGDALMFKTHPFVAAGIGNLDLYLLNQV